MKLHLSNRDKGFTLVELLVAMAIGVAVMGAVYSLYNYFLRASAGQDSLLEIQQETRVTMEKLVKEVRAAGCYYRNTPIITAGASTFEFEADTDPNPTLGPWKVKYDLDTAAKELTRSSAVWNDAGKVYGAYGTAVDLVGNITGITFSYYDDTDTLLSTPVTLQTQRDKIRRVGIALTAATPYPNPSTKKIDTVNLETSVSLRCMGVQQSTDKTECLLPTNLQSTDPGTCGTLNLSWVKSASSDAAGYKLYYKMHNAAFYTGLIDIPGGSTQAYTLTGLTNNKQYDIAMKCYDTSGNVNAAYTSVLTGITAPADTHPDDTTPPALPTNSNATAGDGVVNLTWDPHSPTEDIGGYHVYRSDYVGAAGLGSYGPYTQVAEIDSTHSTYSDMTVSNCPEQPFQYKVVSWDCAANEQDKSAQSAVAGDGSNSGPDYPTAGITSTDPFETVPPADPVPFQVVAGSKKIYMSHTTPADLDLNGVRILRKTGGYPTGPTDTGAVGPGPLGGPGQPDYEPLNANQTYSLIDAYNVVNNTIYYYKAFAYDRCGNYSPGSDSSAKAAPCGDGLVDSDAFGPPSAPASLTSATCSTSKLSWPASTGSENGKLFNNINNTSDVAGYIISRGTTSGGPYTDLNSATNPVTTLSYADSTVVPGTTYYYTVKSVDCADKVSTVPSPEVTVMPTNIAWDPAITVVTSATASPLKGGQHNVIKLGIRNTGNSSITINSATFVWGNAAAKLHTVTLKPFGGSTNKLWDYTDVASGNVVDFSSFEPTASLRRLNGLTGLNEFVLDFRDSTGTGFVDMRGENIIVTLNYTNDLDNVDCNSNTFTVPVTIGPTITGSVQDRPVTPTTSNVNPASITVETGYQGVGYVWNPYDVVVSDTMVPSPEPAATLAGATLYYATTDKSTHIAPATDYSDYPSGWSTIPMCQVSAANTYQTASFTPCSTSHIPNLTGKRVWYYVKMTDSNSNYDIQPEPSVGVYTYDQNSRFNVDMTVDRSGNGGENVALTAVLTDENYQPVSGATVTALIIGLPAATVEIAAMAESAVTPGTYTYTSTQLYHDKKIHVFEFLSKNAFTNAQCSIADIIWQATQSTRSCN